MKFLLTRELGRLSKWLRILGFDTLYTKQMNLSSIFIQALKEDRIILTRNHRICGWHGQPVVKIEAEELRAQIKEIIQKLNINIDPKRMFTRCLICNLGLVAVSKEELKDRVPEYVFLTQDKFVTCPGCGRVFWQGTHWGNVNKILEEIV